MQIDALKGADCDTIYADTAKGNDETRKGLQTALHKCRHGDQLVVWRLDRLSRKVTHLVGTVEQLTDRGIDVRVLSGRGTHANFSDPEGRFVLGVIASFAQLEHETCATRTRYALGMKSSLGFRASLKRKQKCLREHFWGVSNCN